MSQSGHDSGAIAPSLNSNTNLPGMKREKLPESIAEEGNEPAGSTTQAIAFAVVLAMLIALWVAMSEILQGVQAQFPKPFAITFVIHVGYSIMLVPAAVLAYCRRNAEVVRRKSSGHSDAPVTLGWTFDQFKVPFLQIVWLTFALCFVTAGVAYFWYYSLPRTTVAANNAIYQSASVFVYLFSFLMLGETLTLQKGAAVLVSVGGVAAISFAPKHASSDPGIHPSTLGYAMVIVSTCIFALYEVLYARFAEGHGSKVDRPKMSMDEDAGGERVGKQATTTSTGIGLGTRSEFSVMSAEEGGHRRSDGDQSQEPLLQDSESKAGVSGGLGSFGTAAGGGAAPPGSAEHQGKGVRRPLAEAEAEAEAEAGAREVWLQLEMSCLVLGLIGVWTALVLWPVFFVLSASGLEPFRLPSRHTLDILLGNVVLDSMYNGLLLFGVAVSSPLAMSVGSMLVVPASIAADYFIHGTLLSALGGVGVVLIVAGFVLLKLTPSCMNSARAACGLGDETVPVSARAETGMGPESSAVATYADSNSRDIDVSRVGT